MCHLNIDAFDQDDKYKIKYEKSKRGKKFLQKIKEYCRMNLKTQ